MTTGIAKATVWRLRSNSRGPDDEASPVNQYFKVVQNPERQTLHSNCDMKSVQWMQSHFLGAWLLGMGLYWLLGMRLYWLLGMWLYWLLGMGLYWLLRMGLYWFLWIVSVLLLALSSPVLSTLFLLTPHPSHSSPLSHSFLIPYPLLLVSLTPLPPPPPPPPSTPLSFLECVWGQCQCSG